MKNAIKEYLTLSTKEKNKIWENATFVFDTNIFLNLYRYTENTRKALLDSIKKIKEKIWIPYQVAYEFMKDRPAVIFETVCRYDELIDKGNRFIEEVQKNLRLPNDDKSLTKLHEDINNWINERKKNDLYVDHPSKDHLLNELLILFDKKVGKQPTEEVLKKRIDEGKKRYERKIPPGYKDNEKSKRGDNSEYGDYFVWEEILEFSKEKKTDIIYVTNDQKEDWWSIVKGKTLGPRVELKKEFFEKTNKNFLLYTMNSFIDYMKEKGSSISDEVIAEIKTTPPIPTSNDNCQTNTTEKNELDLEHYMEYKDLRKQIDSLQMYLYHLNKESLISNNPKIQENRIQAERHLHYLLNRLKILEEKRFSMMYQIQDAPPLVL